MHCKSIRNTKQNSRHVTNIVRWRGWRWSWGWECEISTRYWRFWSLQISCFEAEKNCLAVLLVNQQPLKAIQYAFKNTTQMYHFIFRILNFKDNVLLSQTSYAVRQFHILMSHEK
jgi:hypothetical protein